MRRKGTGGTRQRHAAPASDEWYKPNERRPRNVALAVVALAAGTFLLLWLMRPGQGGSQEVETSEEWQPGALRYHGEHVDRGTACGPLEAKRRGGECPDRKRGRHFLTEKEQRANLALQETGDPQGISVKRAIEQAEHFVALFVEACPVDGPSYCGTYRADGVVEGQYPVYRNQYSRVLYRNTQKHMWVIIDGELYTPELSTQPDLPGSHRANTLTPTTEVPPGSNDWVWGSEPPASYHELVELGVVKDEVAMLRNELTLTVTGLVDEDEVGRFEGYAEEQLELQLEAGDADATGTEGVARPPVTAFLEMPYDIGSSTRLKLLLRSGTGAELGITGDARKTVGQLLNVGDLMLSDIDIPQDQDQPRRSADAWDTTASPEVSGPVLRCGENQLECYGWQTKGRKKKGKWVKLTGARDDSGGGAMMAGLAGTPTDTEGETPILSR